MQTICFQHSKTKTPLNLTGINQLELWQWLHRHIYTWFCPKISGKFQASPASSSTTCPTCMDNDCKWKTNSICDHWLKLSSWWTCNKTSTSNILYYAHVVDPTILPALNKISNQQTKPTEKALKACRQLGDNLQTNPKAVIQCNTSDMMFSGASYLVLPDDRSRCVTLYTLTDILHPSLPP